MDQSQRQKLLDLIDSKRDHAVDFLQTLIRFPSVTGDEGPIQAHLKDYLEDMDLDIDMWDMDAEEIQKHPAAAVVTESYEGRPNIVATRKGTGGGRSLLLNGHTDVIPEGPRESWTDDPWEAKIRDNRIYGRGSSDMKSGVSSQILAVQYIEEAGIKLKGDVLVNLVVDEEVSGHGTLDTVLRGYKADAAISGETSTLAVQPACIGRIWFQILIRGKKAGIQTRYEGVNAIDLGYKIKVAIDDHEKHRLETVSHPLYPHILSTLPCLVGTIESGSFPSAFPDTCLLKGSIATVPGESHEGVKQAFLEHISKVVSEDEWMKEHPPEVTFGNKFGGLDAEAADIPADHPIVTTLVDCFKEVTGKDPEISGRQGAADTRFLINNGDTPTVIFGPGPTAVMHANDEYVDIDDYMTAIKVYALSICEWCEAQ
ncbi:MAG: ArgE/DapE family deacylase [Hyphomicrobiaceae bacterium]|nr:ArgE/DapE family deacylase [Hyphomicrobiaceae bacterium]